jgi:NhaP-type Na+/H+ or K+/H+ antiporter
VTAYEVLSRYSTRMALWVALMVFVSTLLRLVSLPLAVLALVVGRLVLATDAAATVPAVRGVRVGGVG